MPLTDEQFRSECEAAIGGDPLRWFGRPTKSIVLVRCVPLLLLGGPAVIFAIVWLLVIIGARDPQILSAKFKVLGVIATLLSIALMTIPFMQLRRARSVGYGVTGTRLVVFRRRPDGSIHIDERPIASCRRIERRFDPSGNGDLVFEKRWRRGLLGFPWLDTFAFTAVTDARSVHATLVGAESSDAPSRNP